MKPMKGKMGIGAGFAIVGVFAIVAVLVVSGVFKLPSLSVTPGAPGAPAAAVPVTLVSEACNSQATVRPELRFAAVNPLNTTGSEYSTSNARIYEGNFIGQAVVPDTAFKGTLAGGSTGLQSRGSGAACDCGKTYTVIIPATDGTETSTVWTQTCATNDNTQTVNLPQQGTLNFKVYDEINKGYLYASSEATAGGNFHDTGKTFYSTTSNSSGPAIGVNGEILNTIIFKVNSTAYTDRQFEDEELLLAIDAQDLTDWQKPTTLSMSGATFTERACPSKVANDAYDWCWTVSANGEPKHVTTSQLSLLLGMLGKSGVNPTDDIKVALLTSGWYKQTIGEGATSSYNKDDSSETYVFTAQTLTLNID